MPQLDTVTFFNQLFWFTLVFFGFYFFVLGTIIPKLTLVLKARAKKLQQDMSSSAALKAEAASIMGSYDKEFIALSGSLVSGVNTSLESRSQWLAAGDKL
jgi:F0F1-type ATP synthase membrane subunit b/b'